MSNPSLNRSEPKVGDRAAEITNLSPLVIRARLVFRAIVMIFAICILIQVFLAGLALFWDSARWASHTGFGKLLMLPPILMLVTSFIARLPASFRLSSAIFIGLIVLMFVTAKLSSEMGYLSALHPVFALMMFMGAVSNVQKINALIKGKQKKSEEHGV